MPTSFPPHKRNPTYYLSMAPIVAQTPIIIALFSTIGACLTVVLVYMAVKLELYSRKEKKTPTRFKEAHPLTWKSKPST